jgi:PKD repeat protein
MCLGDSLILVPTITSPGNGGPYTYSWSNGGTTPTVMVYGSVPTSTNYVLTVSDGCTLPSATAVFTVVTNPPPVVNIVADYLSGNAPLTVNFADLGSGGTTFNWNFGNGNPSTASNPGPHAVTFNSASTGQVITLTVSNPNGLQSSASLNIVVQAVPNRP